MLITDQPGGGGGGGGGEGAGDPGLPVHEAGDEAVG